MPEIRVVVSDELDKYMNTVVSKGMFGSKAELIRASLIRYFETLPLRVPSGYDATTLFSPDGRIFQIEYALECAVRGAITVGLRYRGGVLLAKQRSMPEGTVGGPWEYFELDEHIGAVPSGIASDYILIRDKAMREAEAYRNETGKPIAVEELVKRLALFMQSYTMKKDVRPLGCIVLVGGVDQTGNRLFALDPGGSYREVIWKVTGYQFPETEKTLKGHYKPDMSLQEALDLTIKAVLKEKKRKPEELAVAVVERETNKLRRITSEEMKNAWKAAFGKS